MEDKKKSELEKQVEENLRRVYQAKAGEPVPERFMELLQKLRSQEQGNNE
jgi:hypothetical protein